MGPELTATPRTTGCPACGASLRPDAQWCGQCYADVRPPAPVPQPEPEPTPVAVLSPAPPPSSPLTRPSTAQYGEPARDPLTAPLVDFLPAVPAPSESAPPEAAPAEGRWPCLRCEVLNPLAAPACVACGASFLSGDASLSLVVPGVGDLVTMSRGRRAVVALGLVGAVLVPLALVTFLLTGEPPPDDPGLAPPPSTSEQAPPPAGPG